PESLTPGRRRRDTPRRRLRLQLPRFRPVFSDFGVGPVVAQLSRKVPKPSDTRGFTLFEVVLVLGLVLVIGAISIPLSGNALTQFRLSGDARGLSNSISVAKMRAASHFTRVRLFVDLSDNSY